MKQRLIKKKAQAGGVFGPGGNISRGAKTSLRGETFALLGVYVGGDRKKNLKTSTKEGGVALFFDPVVNKKRLSFKTKGAKKF